MTNIDTIISKTIIEYKMKTIKTLLLSIIFTAGLSACSDSDESQKHNNISGRDYTQIQVSQGQALYEANCMVCHGAQGQGTQNWQQPLADGSYPPPPLNGSAHTWHHPKKALIHTIKNGGQALGGKMPGFKDKFDDNQIDSILAYMLSLWPEEIYQSWRERNKSN